MQREWAEIQANKLTTLELYVTQCREAVQSISHPQALSSFSSIELKSSESDRPSSSDPDAVTQEDSCKQIARSYKKVTYSLKIQQQTLARLQLPSWLRLTNLCLEICGRRSLYGMSLDVKVYRIVSWDDPITKYARKGNVRGIQELFSQGIATPLDRLNEHGTVLDVR
jgi:hypothetical protein